MYIQSGCNNIKYLNIIIMFFYKNESLVIYIYITENIFVT